MIGILPYMKESVDDGIMKLLRAIGISFLKRKNMKLTNLIFVKLYFVKGFFSSRL